jgi:hypothetical protein
MLSLAYAAMVHYESSQIFVHLYSGDDSLVVEVTLVLALLEVLLDSPVPMRDE